MCAWEESSEPSLPSGTSASRGETPPRRGRPPSPEKCRSATSEHRPLPEATLTGPHARRGAVTVRTPLAAAPQLDAPMQQQRVLRRDRWRLREPSWCAARPAESPALPAGDRPRLWAARFPGERRADAARARLPPAGSAAGGCSRLCASADQDKGTGHSVGAAGAGGAALRPHAWVEEVTSEREPALCGIHREMPAT